MSRYSQVTVVTSANHQQGTSVDLFDADRSESGWSSRAGDCQDVQDGSSALQPARQRVDGKICDVAVAAARCRNSMFNVAFLFLALGVMCVCECGDRIREGIVCVSSARFGLLCHTIWSRHAQIFFKFVFVSNYQSILFLILDYYLNWWNLLIASNFVFDGNLRRHAIVSTSFQIVIALCSVGTINAKCIWVFNKV